MPIPETPFNRKETYMAAAAGQEVSIPKPVTREDRYWSAIVDRLDDVLSQFADVRAISDAMPELNLAVHVIETLPEQGEENAIYLVPSDNSITHARFAKYIWIDGAWEALSVAETIMSVMDAWDRKMYWTLYGRLSGNLLIYQGRALDKVTTDMAYAGTAAQLTIISALGESTTTVEIDANGEIPIGSFSTVKAGFNLIFCETDPTQKDGNKLAGPTAIPLTAIYLRSSSDFADMTFSQFLTIHHLSREYVLVQPRPQELDPNRKYFIRFYESFQPIWDALDTADGYYFIGIDQLEDAQNEDIYTLEILRTGT